MNSTIPMDNRYLEDLVLAEQVRSLYRTMKVPYISDPISIVALIPFYWDKISHHHLFLWGLAVTLILSPASMLLSWYFKCHSKLPEGAARWLGYQQIRYFLGSLAYGLSGFVLFVSGSTNHQLVLFCFLVALTATLMAETAQHRSIPKLTILPLLIPLIIRAAIDPDRTANFLALLTASALIYTMLTANNLSKFVKESLNQRFTNEVLVEQLQTQTQVAEHARREAVEANQAKSRFLAAASHDLRQPMHALGLFASAVRPHIATPDGQHIVDKIESSIASTEVMFNALLDVSRLDAGILLPDIKTFALGDLLARLAVEYAPRAETKNLRLRLRSTQRLVLSDPTLLERMIRNYISNAIRYTQRGGVLIGTRVRGDQLRVEIWDTGDGIPREEIDEIFQEFYQLGNPERDKAKGLGLGLAIVKRIGELLSHPIEVKSKLGRGSKFSVSVPLAAGNAQTATSASEIQYDDSLLIGATILVIDDDKNVLEAARILLKQWGCYALSAESATDALAKLREEDRAPDVILSDYRLRDGETGTDAIRKIHSVWGTMPAALITGDTAPDRLKEATASGYELLHKPLNPIRLKVALCKMLTVATPEGAPSLPHST